MLEESSFLCSGQIPSRRIVNPSFLEWYLLRTVPLQMWLLFAIAIWAGAYYLLVLQQMPSRKIIHGRCRRDHKEPSVSWCHIGQSFRNKLWAFCSTSWCHFKWYQIALYVNWRGSGGALKSHLPELMVH